MKRTFTIFGFTTTAQDREETLSRDEECIEDVNYPDLRTKRAKVDRKVYQCSECDYTTNYASSMSIHRRSHSGEKPFKCEMCPEEFASSNARIQHSSKHNRKEKYTCPFCSLSSCTKTGIVKHFNFHEDTREYKCKDCDFATNKIEEYYKHGLTHYSREKDKKHTCGECEKKFSSLESLKKHKKTIHQGQGLKCPNCPYTTYNKKVMRRHCECHTLNGEFTCRYCNYSSNKKRTVVVHEKKVHKEHMTDYPTIPCSKKQMESASNVSLDAQIFPTLFINYRLMDSPNLSPNLSPHNEGPVPLEEDHIVRP